MITRSSGASPLRTTRSPSTSGPSWTVRGATVPSGADGQHHAAGLVGHDRRIGHHQRRGLAGEQAQPGEAAGGQEEVRVRHHGAAADRAAAGIEAAVDEVHAAFAVEIGLIKQAKLHHRLGLTGAAPHAALRRAGVAEVLCLAGVEGDIDGVERHQGGQQRDALLHQVASIDAAVADAARARRADLREFEVELRLVQCGAGGGEAGLRFAQRAAPRVHLGLRCETLLDQRRVALHLLLGEGEPGLVAGDLGTGGLDRDLEGSLVQREQQVAGTDQRAILEMYLHHLAGDTRADLDPGRGLDPGGVLIPFRHLAGQRGGHGDRRRGGGALSLRRRRQRRAGQQRQSGRACTNRFAWRGTSPACVRFSQSIHGLASSWPERALR